MKTIAIFALITLVACDTINPVCHNPVTVSPANPVQFWPIDCQTYNEKEVCGIYSRCYCQPWQCDDEIKVQFTDDSGFLFDLSIRDSSDNEIVRVPFEEISDNTFYASFIPEDGSSPEICDTKVRAYIVRTDAIALESAVARVAENNEWYSITYGNGIFVAVSSTGGTHAMYSSDGITWTTATTSLNTWKGVTFGNGLFVAVADSGTGDRVMTSPDGINWTLRNSAGDYNWRAVTFGNNLFVAVATGADGDRVMTSPDGITWTLRASAGNHNWIDVTFGNDLFVAVGSSGGTSNQVMTSPDGITWTMRTSAANNSWLGVTYGEGLFVAVAASGTGNRVMTSPDGINWTARASAADNQWRDVVYGGGLFAAVASSGSGNRIMYSPDGINWTIGVSSADNSWYSIAYDPDAGLFAAVSITGTSDKVMTAQIVTEDVDMYKSDCLDIRTTHECTNLIEYSNNRNYAGLVYSDVSPTPSFQIRVRSIFFHEEFPQEDFVMELTSGIEKTSGVITAQKRFDVDRVPYYMHKKLILIFEHQSILIDDAYWTKQERYEMIENQKQTFPMKKGQVLLTMRDFVQRSVL